jgi:hypothetical protein
MIYAGTNKTKAKVKGTVVLGTSLSGYALLNASRTAANDFDAK